MCWNVDVQKSVQLPIIVVKYGSSVIFNLDVGDSFCSGRMTVAFSRSVFFSACVFTTYAHLRGESSIMSFTEDRINANLENHEAGPPVAEQSSAAGSAAAQARSCPPWAVSHLSRFCEETPPRARAHWDGNDTVDYAVDENSLRPTLTCDNATIRTLNGSLPVLVDRAESLRGQRLGYHG